MDDFIEVVGSILLIIIMILGLALLAGLPTMLLWNALMPMLFGLSKLTFWQSVGVVLLAHCIFPSSSVKSSN